MVYVPKHAVWEITYACNMCCKHCGSSCGQAYPDELTHEEALKLCDDIADLGLGVITLSGGEPFVREDWHLLAKRLTDKGVITNVISNGWFIDDALIDKALQAGIVNIGISLDGLKDTHDFIRKEGSYDRIMSAFHVMNKRNIPIAVNTSVNKRNLAELPELKKILIDNNVRQVPLRELWTRPGAFAWNREMTAEQLTGFCAQCRYRKTCLGGCAGSKLTFCHSLYENTYCTYRIKVERELEKIKTINDLNKLIQAGTRYMNEKEYQLADIYFSRALSIDPVNSYVIDCMGFVHFFLEDYNKSREYNENALKLNPKNAYAWKGLGLCLTKTGQVEKGIYYITKAIQLSKDDSSDYYLDLAVVLDEHNKTKEAIKILEKVRKHSEEFIKKSEELYGMLKKKLNCAQHS